MYDKHWNNTHDYDLLKLVFKLILKYCLYKRTMVNIKSNILIYKIFIEIKLFSLY